MTALQGMVLDLDGLLIDSERWSWQAHNAALAAFGAPALSLEDVQCIIGLHRPAEWIALRAMRDLPDDAAAYAVHWHSSFQILRDKSLAPLPGVHELLAAASRIGLRLAIASNSPLAYVHTMLSGLGIQDRFVAICSGDEVPQGKPAPDVYELAAERLGLPVSQVIAVEDSAVGLRAAKAAGLFCAVAPSELTGTQDFSTADIRLAALGDLASWLVAGSPGFSASQPVEGT